MQVKLFGKNILEVNSEKRSATGSLTNLKTPSDWIASYFGIKPGAVTVDETTAFNLVPVWSCVRLLSQTIASLPLNLYVKGANGNREIMEQHPIQNMIKYSPSPLYNQFTFRETLMAYLLLWGNAFAVISRRPDQRAVEMELVHPTDVKIGKDSKSNRLFYTIKGYPEPLGQSEVVHIVGLSMNGLLGMSPISAARDAIYLGLATQTFGKSFFENGANVNMALTTPNVLTNEQFERLRDQWNSRYAGLQNANKTAILEGGTDVKSIGIPPEDAQFLQTREFTRSEIAGFFGVPPHLIGDLSKATFSNIEHQSIDFVIHSIKPWAERIEAELNRKLLLPTESNYYIKFNLNGLMRGDSQSRSEYYNKLFQIGVFSQNDIRRLEDMNSIEEGDRYFVPLNMVPSDKLDETNDNSNNNE